MQLETTRTESPLLNNRKRTKRDNSSARFQTQNNYIILQILHKSSLAYLSNESAHSPATPPLNCCSNSSPQSSIRKFENSFTHSSPPRRTRSLANSFAHLLAPFASWNKKSHHLSVERQHYNWQAFLNANFLNIT